MFAKHDGVEGIDGNNFSQTTVEVEGVYSSDLLG